MYQVKLRQFEGPFDLLVETIESKKLSINQISLAEVTDQYLNYLKEIQYFPTPEVASFVVVASTLMLIKSRTLIPSLHLTEEEQTEVRDLEERIALYQKYRELAKKLEAIFGKQLIFGREPFAQITETFIEPKNLTAIKLRDIMKIVLDNLPKKEILPETMIKKTVSLEKKMEELTRKLTEKISFCFSDLSMPGCEKVEIIINFLAVLELIKRGFIMAKQGANFEKIEIAKYDT